MSLLSENDKPQNSTPLWDPTGRLTSVDGMVESELSLASFYKDVFCPAMKSLEEALVTILLEWFSGGLNTIGQLVNWYNTQQTEKETKRNQRTTTSRRIPEPLPIPLEAPIGLRKVIGDKAAFDSAPSEDAMREGGKRHASLPVRPLTKSNPWMEAAKKQLCKLEVQQPQHTRSTRRKKTLVDDEPNRGLDDIYTRPVSSFFNEENESSFKKPGAALKKGFAPKLNTQMIAALLESALEQNPPPKQNEPQIARPVASPLPKKAEPEDSYFNWAELQPTPSHIIPKIPDTAPPVEPLESEFIPGFNPCTNPSQSEQKPVAKQQTVAEPSQESLAPKPSQQALKSHGASVLLAKAKAASLEFKRQMPVYQELQCDMSGAEYMARNNLILHNSISTLADTYFKRAAEEEQHRQPY